MKKKLAYILLRKIHMFSLFIKMSFIAAMYMTVAILSWNSEILMNLYFSF